MSSVLLNKDIFTGPMLRSLRLAGQWQMDRTVGQCAQRWAPLTDLKIELCSIGSDSARFNASQALGLLEALPRLVTASFALQHEKPGDAVENHTPIKLSHLKYLSLRGVPMRPGFARSLILPSLNAMHLIFEAYPGGDSNSSTSTQPDGYEAGILELLRIFGTQLSVLALNPEPFTLASFPSCLNNLSNKRLETLSLIDKNFPTPPDHFALYGVDAKQQLDYAALSYLADPSVLPNLKYFEMAVRNLRWDAQWDLALVEMIAARRRMSANFHLGEKGCEALVRESVVKVGPEEDAAQSKCCIRDVHVALSWWTYIDIVDELKARGVDLEVDPFSIRLDYPYSRRRSIGELSPRPWTERR